MEVTKEQADGLTTLLKGLESRSRALVEIDNLESEAAKAQALKAAAGLGAPLIERLDEYPAGGADLANLVIYPPRLRPVPVKPLFLDTAWNYIQYPTSPTTKAPSGGVAKDAGMENKGESKETRRGWFGFGR